jgi:hypothetical protein
MDDILGTGNGFLEYGLILLIDIFVFLLVFYPKRKIELNSRTGFWVLYFFWSLAMFFGNYIAFKIGFMAFLPWLDNFIHSFGWVGLGLGWLYFSSLDLPWYYRFFLASMFSFIIKFFENFILGTWLFDPWFFFTGKYAYIIAMSALDGLYPILSDILLKALHKKFPSVYLNNQMA